jgi:hypothetical protein
MPSVHHGRTCGRSSRAGTAAGLPPGTGSGDSVDRIARVFARNGSMADQLRRSAESIVLNIAEGAGHYSPGRKIYHYQLARGSAGECIAALTHLSSQALRYDRVCRAGPPTWSRQCCPPSSTRSRPGGNHPRLPRRSSPAPRRPPFVARPMSPAVRRPPHVARRSSPAPRRPPFVARPMSPAVRRPVPVGRDTQ